MTAYFNQTVKDIDKKKGGVLIHSKKQGHGYGYDNWKAFEDRLDQAVKPIVSAQ